MCNTHNIPCVGWICSIAMLIGALTYSRSVLLPSGERTVWEKEERQRKEAKKTFNTQKKYKPSSAFDCVLLIWLPLVFFSFCFMLRRKCRKNLFHVVDFTSVLLLCWSVSCAASAENFLLYMQIPQRMHATLLLLWLVFFGTVERTEFQYFTHLGTQIVLIFSFNIYNRTIPLVSLKMKNWVSHAQMAASDRQARIAQQTRNYCCHLNLCESILLRKSPDHQLVASSEIRETQFSSSLNLMT